MTIPPHCRIRNLIFACVLTFGTLDSEIANAQTAAPSADAQREATEHDKRGIEAVRRADADKARREFLQSYVLVPSSKTLWNLLVAEVDSGHPLDALKHLRTYLADPNADANKKEKGRGLLSELNAQAGHLRITVPESASLSVDGVTITGEQRKNVIDVAPGTHAIEATIKNESQRRELDVPAGKETVVAFEAPASESAAVPPPASATPLPPQESPPVQRSRGIWPPPTASWILGGVAVAALGAGIGFSLASQSNKDESGNSPNACSNPTSTECAELHDAIDTGRRNSTISWIAYGGAGAALAAGSLIWVFSSKTKSTVGRTNIVPMGGPGIAGVRIQASF